MLKRQGRKRNKIVIILTKKRNLKKGAPNMCDQVSASLSSHATSQVVSRNYRLITAICYSPFYIINIYHILFGHRSSLVYCVPSLFK